MVNAGAVITVTYAPQKVKNATNAEFEVILQKKCLKPQKSQSQATPPPQTNVNHIDVTNTKNDDEGWMN